MKKAHTSPRQTGNKTVTQPRVLVNHEAAKGGMSSAGMKRGYDVKGKVPVHTSPLTEPNNKP